MKTFIVAEKPLFLHAGIVGLSEKQYQARKTALKPLKKKGQYEILSKICFKVGEEIGFDGPVIKAFRTNLVPAKEFAERGNEAAYIEIDIEKYQKMQSAFEDLKKRYESLGTNFADVSQELAESRLKNEQNEAFILELQKNIEDLKKADGVDDVKNTDGK